MGETVSNEVDNPPFYVTEGGHSYVLDRPRGGAEEFAMFPLTKKELRGIVSKPLTGESFHGVIWLCWLALKFGIRTVDDVLGDFGVLHWQAHMNLGIGQTDFVLLDRGGATSLGLAEWRATVETLASDVNEEIRRLQADDDGG